MRTQHALHTLQAFPVYSLGFVKNDKLLLGGGGGATRSGIKNKLRLYDVDETGAKLELLNELELEKDEDAPMSMAIDHGHNSFICGINGSIEKVEAGVNPHCRAFSVEMKEDMKPLKELGGLPGLSLSPASVGPTGLQLMQKVTALSKDGTLLAAGSSDGKPFNQVTLVSYPKLDLASEPFTIPSGELFDADFSTDGYLIVTSTTNLYVFSPSSAPSKMSPSTAHPQLNLVNTIPVPASHPNSSYRSTRWSPHDSKTAWSIINNTNGSSKDRRGWVARWSITGLGEGEKSQGKGEWKVARIAKVATRPITVFDVSQDGKLLAFGSSDLSVGILDSQKLVPLLTILRAHEFPPTALRFNPSGSLLASASADNTLRLIAVPSSFGQSAMTTILILFVLLVGLLAVLIQRGDIIW
ncbi:WD40 repeats protein [Rhizoctonia solani]|uniref:WD40 repeats protein n=1 Tax=Rhizoctonia solani TaxID=456999 RepID=A0A8H7LL80_9AGAM|nr:WD40 repeats protein [Rhizoctonia solani]